MAMQCAQLPLSGKRIGAEKRGGGFWIAEEGMQDAGSSRLGKRSVGLGDMSSWGDFAGVRCRSKSAVTTSHLTGSVRYP
eukprot:2812887-Rhodomonas_salina.1